MAQSPIWCKTQHISFLTNAFKNAATSLWVLMNSTASSRKMACLVWSPVIWSAKERNKQFPSPTISTACNPSPTTKTFIKWIYWKGGSQPWPQPICWSNSSHSTFSAFRFRCCLNFFLSCLGESEVIVTCNRDENKTRSTAVQLSWTLCSFQSFYPWPSLLCCLVSICP